MSFMMGANATSASRREGGGKHDYSLSLEEFSDARDREFADSCAALGFRPSHVCFHPNRGVDGSLANDEAKRIIESFLAFFDPRTVTICTTSPFVGPGQHRDHRTLGQAAVDLYRKGAFHDLRLFVEPYCVDEFRANNPQVELVETRPFESERASLKAAITSYCRWDPGCKRYAVGYHSVTNEFNDFINDPASYHHTLEDMR